MIMPVLDCPTNPPIVFSAGCSHQGGPWQTNDQPAHCPFTARNEIPDRRTTEMQIWILLHDRLHCLRIGIQLECWTINVYDIDIRKERTPSMRYGVETEDSICNVFGF